LLFSSPLFLFFFLPVFAIAYAAAPRSAKNMVILAGSLFFYAWAEPKFIAIVIASAMLDWICGWLTFHAKTKPPKLLWMWVGIVGNIGLLFYFKYANFFLSTFAAAFASVHLAVPVLKLVLPIGISFIVFEKITYLVDIYRERGKPATNVFSYMVYVFFFPKLLAGPIVKYHDIVDQFEQRQVRLSDVEAGFLRFLSGLAKKILLADCLAGTADTIFSTGGTAVGTLYAWLGVACFTLQIYFDFSGYSDMAIGMARMMGFRLRENFNMPYLATSFTDFWHRWHLSLSSWIREYLYIPLGGSRGSAFRTYSNLWICFLLSGLWHGAAWTFVFWGFYHGLGLVCDKLFWLKAQPKVPVVLARALTLFFVVIGWVFFRAVTFHDALDFLASMFTWHPPTQFVYVSSDVLFVLAVGTLFSFVRPVDLYTRIARHLSTAQPIPILRSARALGILSLLLVCLARASANSFHPFLYFRF
jgi:alginate O-acetyltransferase complex protein AlgI